MTILQEEIQAQRQTLGELQAELDAADAQLADSGRQQAAMNQDVVQLQQRINEAGQALTAEHQRLDDAKRAGDAAEQYAKDVRARVQREAKRVAELAAAAVMAAAAGGATDTGEFPRLSSRRPRPEAATGHRNAPPSRTRAILRPPAIAATPAWPRERGSTPTRAATGDPDRRRGVAAGAMLMPAAARRRT